MTWIDTMFGRVVRPEQRAVVIDAECRAVYVDEEETEEMPNYYTIIRCVRCDRPIQAVRRGSKQRIVRYCKACLTEKREVAPPAQRRKLGGKVA